MQKKKPSLLAHLIVISLGILALIVSSLSPSVGPLGYLASVATYLVVGTLIGYWWPANLWRWVVLVSLPFASYFAVGGASLVSAYVPASKRGVLSVLVSLAFSIPIIAVVVSSLFYWPGTGHSAR